MLSIPSVCRALPEIAIPLLPGDGDVAVDLQEVFQRSYDAGPYRRRIRYRQTEPVPPLDAEAGSGPCDSWTAAPNGFSTC